MGAMSTEERNLFLFGTSDGGEDGEAMEVAEDAEGEGVVGSVLVLGLGVCDTV